MKNNSWKLRALSLAMCAVMGLSPVGEAGTVWAAGESAEGSQIHVYAPTADVSISIKTGGNIHDYGKSGDDPTTDVDESQRVYSKDYLANASYGESEKYSMTANQTAISVYQYRKNSAPGNRFYHMDVARFSSDDPAATLVITVKDNSDISNAVIYPEKYYPKNSYVIDEDNRTITVQMSSELGYCILDTDGDNGSNSGDPQLAIINDPTEQNKPNINADNVLNFKTFADAYLKEHSINDTVGNKCTDAGKVTDKATGIEWEYTDGSYQEYSSKGVAFPNKRARLSYDVSEAFQAALEEVKKSSTLNTIYFPAGTYVWSGLQISGWNGNGGDGALNIYVDENALLVNRLQECKEAMEPAIGIWNSSNITISGRGIFDGQGAYAQVMDSKGADQSCHQGGCMVVHSENITFNDTYVRDAKQWNWECHSGVNITYNNIKGLSPYQHSWVDGLDLTSGQNITVNGAITMGNDDCFATGHYNSSNGFGAATQTGEETEEKKNLAAAAAVYNGDRFSWDAMDSQNYRINNTLGWSTFATAIKFGHSVKWKKNEDGTTSSYTLKDYEFNNVNTLHVYGSSANGGGGGIQIRNGVNGGYPEYDKIVFNNCSLTATNGGSWVQAPNTSTANFKPEEITLNNCWFNKADTSFSFASIQTAKVADLYLDGELVRYTSQADMSVAPTVDNFIFTANGEPVIANELPVFTSPADTSKTAYVGNPLVFYVKVSDADGDEVRFGDVDLGGLTGAAFDKETGEFCWIPSEENAGNTYEVTFTAYDKTYEDTHDSSELKVKISVVDAGATVETPYAAAEDARVASWKGNKTTAYGEGLYLTTNLIPDQGLLGEKFQNTNTNDGTDGKISYVKFDLSQLPNLDYEKADFMVTLIGVRASTASDSIRAAVVEDNSWSEKDITWVSRPEITVTDNTVLTSDSYDTSASSVLKENVLTNTYKPGSTLAMRVDITDVLKKALENYKTDGESKKYLTLAFCNTSGSEIFFASREMAVNNSNMTADMAPSIVLTTETELEIKGTDTLKLYEGYESCQTDSFALLGSGKLSASLESSTDKITWDSGKQQIAIESGLEKGTYTARLTVTGENGVSAEHIFTLKVVKDPENMTPEDFKEYIIAQFNFDGEIDGFNGGGASAAGTYTLADSYSQKAGKALYLDGNANYLTVTGKDGKSLLTDVGELTISFDAKADRTASNWVFYAAPDNNPQTTGNRERYLGILQKNGRVTVERYKNSGKRPANPSADVDGWYHMDVVVAAADTRIYVNGELAAVEASSYQLQDILEKESILMIGKANWHDGEYYKGWIDNMTIYSEALTDKVIKENAKEFLSTYIAEIRVDAPSDCIIGDSLNQDNLKVTAVYKDGTEMDVTGEVLSAEGAVSGFDSGTAGVKTVTISYGGRTNTFKTNMRTLSSIRVEKAPEKTEYILGEEMNTAGMKVTAVYVLGDDANPENEKEYDVTEAVLADENAVSGFNANETGRQTVKITYKGKMAEFEVTVAAKPVGLDTTALSEKIKEARAIEKGDYTDESYEALSAAVEKAQEALDTCKTAEDVTNAVAELQKAIDNLTKQAASQIAEIRVDAPSDCIIGDSLNQDNLKVTAVYKDGTEMDVTGEVLSAEGAVSGFDSGTAGVKTVTISYGGRTNTFKTNMRTLSSIRVEKAPEKTEYILGEEMNTAGMKVTAVYVLGDDANPENEKEYDVTEAVLADENAVSGFNANETGRQTVKITYKGKMAEFEVTVAAKPVGLDTTALSEKIKEARAIEKGDYTDESYEALSAAVEKAQEALDTCKTAEDVTNAVAELQKAIDNLTKQAASGNKDALRAAIDRTKDLKETDYTAASWKVLQEALSKAAAVAENADAMQKEVDEATFELSEALRNLEELSPGMKNLNSVLNEAKRLKKDDYTPAAWASFQKALAEAEAVYNNPKATNEQATAAAASLKKAMETVKTAVKVKKISISGLSKKIAEGRKVKLTAKISPSNADNKGVMWKSSNEKVATVNSKGVVTMKKKSGGKSVTITATAKDGSGVKATYKIKSMKGRVTKVTISGKKTVKAGKSLKLKAKVTATKSANKKLNWTTSNKKYATVSSSGKVKTYKAGKGKTVKITAMSTDGSGKKKTVKIKITK